VKITTALALAAAATTVALLITVWAVNAHGRSHAEPGGALAQPMAQPTPEEGALDLGWVWSQGRAVGRGPVRFAGAPMRVEDIDRIVPCGLMVGGHVCPTDHGYFFPKPPEPGRESYPVLAPADGFIVMVSHRTQLAGSTERAREYDDYALTIEHTGTFYTQYDLLTRLDDAILKQLDPTVAEWLTSTQMGPPINVRIPVKAGQVLGRIAGRSLDFSVVNTEVRLPGFLTPALYGHYAWRIHVVDPFDYIDEPLRSQLLALNVRKVEPYFGKCDYDVDGRLVGNWFREGTGGYAGNRADPRGYWVGHLTLAYHWVDPSQVIVSIGDFGGRPRQFGVQGNGPDPVTVSSDSGIVKYELVSMAYSSSGERIELPPQMRGVQGVLLVQLLEDRKLKAEAFPGAAAAQVAGFTAEARAYER